LIALLCFTIVQGQAIPFTSGGSPLLTSSLLYKSLSPQTCCSDQTISVYGAATIQAAPDTATINVQMTVNADTVSSALALLATQINHIISILTANSFNVSNYQTSSLNVYPNTTYVNGVWTTVGQIASESLTINIPVLNSNGSNIGKLIDDLAAVNGINLNGISFDILNKTSQLTAARAKAFLNAQRKASDYTGLLQLCLGQVVTITDSYSVAPAIVVQNNDLLPNSNTITNTPTTIEVGTIPISYNVYAVYSFG
jgi:uncharacterized protein